jgi:hypothetical protein
LVDDVDVVGPLGHVDIADAYRGDLALSQVETHIIPSSSPSAM